MLELQLSTCLMIGMSEVPTFRLDFVRAAPTADRVCFAERSLSARPICVVECRDRNDVRHTARTSGVASRFEDAKREHLLHGRPQHLARRTALDEVEPAHRVSHGDGHRRIRRLLHLK